MTEFLRLGSRFINMATVTVIETGATGGLDVRCVNGLRVVLSAADSQPLRAWLAQRCATAPAEVLP